ncbi:ATP-dependent DNA helicase [Trichonephila clavata]|uniref:ATP-dependent DNA helicase n=1 Tax=Trichonephila clavata TaxID=2740835 RepID=A0A8X6HPF2_TRICU|nr:ATP-dependent DNA helicase [Trichonephila clavata]
MGRYISSNEAVWRILNFPIHERHPTVIHLSVHLENGQRVYFTEGNAAERARFAPETTLTAFFRLCNEDEFARTLFYHQVPSNYKEACQVRGLLENDEHWNVTLEEAAFMHSPRILRDLFAVMLQVCAVSNPNQLWINHQENLSEDILHRIRIQQRNMDLEFSTEILNEALIIIEDKVRSLGGSYLKSVGLPQPNRDSSTIDDVLRERTYNVSELRRFLEENEGKMLPDQREIFQKITDSVFQETGGNGSFTSLDPDGAVSLKNIGRIVNTEEELLRAVFPNLPDFFQDHVWLCQRAILAPQNQTVEYFSLH